jgi:hypothetical protein
MSESSANLNTESPKPVPNKSWWAQFLEFGEASMRSGKDPVINFYSEREYDCYKEIANMGPLEIYKKKNELLEAKAKGMNPDSYSTEFEKNMVNCAREIMAEKYMYFAQYYRVESTCKEMCEVNFPKGSGTMGFIKRHGCRRECEDKFIDEVKPLINHIRKEFEEKKKDNKEQFNE